MGRLFCEEGKEERYGKGALQFSLKLERAGPIILFFVVGTSGMMVF